jgi:uncharacterized protein (DUF488 family)
MPYQLWTIGHSTLPISEFVRLLHAHGIKVLVDIRTVPRSQHNPQFNTDALARSLAKAGINYQHSAELGGLRKPQKDSLNQGWRNASFRGYADYMQTKKFQRAVEELMAYGTKQNTVIMCAEAVPWRCHRSLIADVLLVNQWEIYHIMSGADAKPHQLTSFARIIDKQLWYPKPDESASAPTLF